MIDVRKEGGLWVVTLNRPEKANSLTADMLATLVDTVRAAHGVAQVLVLTGAGKVFSAGADLDAAKAGLAVSPLWEDLSSALADLPCLTIAALNGTLAGGAFGMALACDLRLGVPEAKFFYPVMKLGYLPQPSDPKRLVALVGPARAKMILMAGQKIDAEEALSWGLVDRLVDRDGLLSAVSELSQAALSATPEHVAGIKGLVRGG
ncbi:enoyl-CoA hydratase/isomerase family protein [Celeribacter sp.]|uniref:enoyl-CoA hydratase/isomerase family protein n=1 Tax=Celeribacter sp. TaxID=1890673 RepID=UPI003A947430